MAHPPGPPQMDAQHERCIALCAACSRICRETLHRHCLVAGDAHLEPAHVEAMADCIALCELAADFIIRSSERHARTCGVCAEACRACAESCRALHDAHMDRCASACEDCADACREMAQETAHV